MSKEINEQITTECRELLPHLLFPKRNVPDAYLGDVCFGCGKKAVSCISLIPGKILRICDNVGCKDTLCREQLLKDASIRAIYLPEIKCYVQWSRTNNTFVLKVPDGLVLSKIADNSSLSDKSIQKIQEIAGNKWFPPTLGKLFIDTFPRKGSDTKAFR